MTEKEKKGFDLVEVPVQTSIAFRDNDTGKVLSMEELLLYIAQEVKEIKKATA